MPGALKMLKTQTLNISQVQARVHQTALSTFSHWKSSWLRRSARCHRYCHHDYYYFGFWDKLLVYNSFPRKGWDCLFGPTLGSLWRLKRGILPSITRTWMLMETCLTVLFGLIEVTWGMVGEGCPGSWWRTEKVWDCLVLVILLKKQVLALFENSIHKNRKKRIMNPMSRFNNFQDKQKSFFFFLNLCFHYSALCADRAKMNATRVPFPKAVCEPVSPCPPNKGM